MPHSSTANGNASNVILNGSRDLQLGCINLKTADISEDQVMSVFFVVMHSIKLDSLSDLGFIIIVVLSCVISHIDI